MEARTEPGTIKAEIEQTPQGAATKGVSGAVSDKQVAVTESVESFADREEAERAARRVSDLADMANRVAAVPADLSVLDDTVYEASIEFLSRQRSSGVDSSPVTIPTRAESGCYRKQGEQLHVFPLPHCLSGPEPKHGRSYHIHELPMAPKLMRQ